MSYKLLIMSLALCAACHSSPPEDENSLPPGSEKEVNKELIPSQIQYVRQETDEINEYIKTHQYHMLATSTGIRYNIYEHGKGEQAKVGDYVKISYKISLLDGTICYDSKDDGPREFLVGKDNVETGIHQAVQLMRQGDKGLFIIPSYLAQGLVGDRDKIPPGAVVVYDITLEKVQHKP